MKTIALRPRKPKRGVQAFSLVEVVLALGIVSFGLLAIFGMFAASLQTNRDIISQQEAFSVSRGLPAFLSQQGFGKIYTNVQTGVDPGIYFYRQLGSNTVFYTNGITTVDPAQREGRLFRVLLGVSPNISLVKTDGSTAVRPSKADLPASVADYTNGVLGLSVRVYSVPQVNIIPTNSFPVMLFDYALPR
jgi:Tfp pilus assembly protein PilV